MGGEMVDKLTMGDRIREARKKCGLTQEQLAEALDVRKRALRYGYFLPNKQTRTDLKIPIALLLLLKRLYVKWIASKQL